MYYDLYRQPITSTGIPIMFYSPNPNWVGVGKSSDIAQQIDIYPTLADLIGYNQPIRSWGRSLFSDKESPRAYISNAQFYQLMQGNYIYVMNPEGKLNGVYKVEDEALKENLLGKENNTEIEKGTQDLRAFMQDYMHRIIQQKLGSPN
ncbi:Putative phosphatidylglycerol-membrane-oligosaccharide glycerophosphotransferase (fragment) [Capnocytophaga canimorsus]